MSLDEKNITFDQGSRPGPLKDFPSHDALDISLTDDSKVRLSTRITSLSRWPQHEWHISALKNAAHIPEFKRSVAYTVVAALRAEEPPVMQGSPVVFNHCKGFVLESGGHVVHISAQGCNVRLVDGLMVLGIIFCCAFVGCSSRYGG